MAAQCSTQLLMKSPRPSTLSTSAYLSHPSNRCVESSRVSAEHLWSRLLSKSLEEAGLIAEGLDHTARIDRQTKRRLKTMQQNIDALCDSDTQIHAGVDRAGRRSHSLLPTLALLQLRWHVGLLLMPSTSGLEYWTVEGLTTQQG